MYRILSINDFEQIKIVYEKYKLIFFESAIIEKINKKFLFGKFENYKLNEIIIVNERDDGLNILFKISDNFDLEKI